MAISGLQVIDVGSRNSTSGSDSLYVAFKKINSNFDKLFACASPFSTFVSGNGIEVISDYANGIVTINNTNTSELVAGDGITIQEVDNSLIISSGTIVYDVGAFIAQSMGSDELVFKFVAVREFTLAQNLTESKASALSAATSTTVLTLYKNSTEFGNITFNSGSTNGTFSSTSAVTFSVNDTLSIIAPTIPDASLADISVTFSGTRS